MRSANKSAGKSKNNGDSSHGTNTTSTLASLPSEVGCSTREAVFQTMVSRVVNKTLFHKKQFIILEQELDVNSKLASKALAALNMEKTKWHLVKEMIQKRLGRRRKAAHWNARKSLLCKWKACKGLFCDITNINNSVCVTG